MIENLQITKSLNRKWADEPINRCWNSCQDAHGCLNWGVPGISLLKQLSTLQFLFHPSPCRVLSRLVVLAAVGAGIFFLPQARAYAQGSQPDDAGAGERWNAHAQATVVLQTHGPFKSPYFGVNSLQARRESRASLTTTFFLGLKLRKGLELYVNPEVAGGKGLSGVTGLASFPNGEITRVTSPTPKPYLGRAFIRQTWGWGTRTEAFEGAPNQLAGQQPVSRATLTFGKMSVTDIFDANTYSHDPRTQFLNWALMDNGAFDYPADTRGYTWGAVLELNQPGWAARLGSFLVSKEANGMALDRHFRRNNGEVAEVEVRPAPFGQPGKVKLLAYVNHANMGTYRQALLQSPTNPDVTSTRRSDTAKYGFGLNVEQSLRADLGAFLRVGWNDGKTETWEFTEIDRTFQAGVQWKGATWRRTQDVVGVAWVVNGLSPAHRDYLAAGGHGYILGDGRLNYSRERILEAYYAWNLLPMFTLTVDYQFAANPGYNRDRGPVSIWGFRLHWER